jgi:hypothetical protein
MKIHSFISKNPLVNDHMVNSTYIVKNVKLKVINRSMMRTATVTTEVTETIIVSNIVKRNATRHGFIFKSPTAKAASSDGNGHHTQEVTVTCNEPNCSTKTCFTPCGELAGAEVKRHFSHKIPNNKTGEYLGPKDLNGTNKDQYAVDSTNPNKNFSASDLKNLTEQDMKPSPKANSFIHDLFNK